MGKQTPRLEEVDRKSLTNWARMDIRSADPATDMMPVVARALLALDAAVSEMAGELESLSIRLRALKASSGRISASAGGPPAGGEGGGA